MFFVLVLGCAQNSEKRDTSELYEKSQAVDEIIKRSGTKLDPESDMELKDAKNRLNIKIFNLEKKYEGILVIYLVFDKSFLSAN